jgi:hypothetical protein
MNHMYLLMAGDNYYPSSGNGDWIKCYASPAEAMQQVTPVQHTRVITKGKHKGDVVVTRTTYTINGSNYDWYEIVNLRDWIDRAG